MLGLYVSDHPLSGLEHVLSAQADVSIATLNADEARPDGSTVVVAGGLVTSLQRKMSKQGNPWAAVTLEDMEAPSRSCSSARPTSPTRPCSPRTRCS